MSSSFPPPNNPFPSGGQPPNPFGPPPNPFGQPTQSFGPPGQPPGFPGGGQSFPPYSGSPYPAGPRLSLLAVASALFGVGGLFTCCCAPVSLPISLLAVVTGHMALIFMNRPQSGLTGKPAAAIGLVSGYLGLLMVGGLLLAAFLSPDPKPAVGGVEVTAATNLSAAESKIVTDNDGIAHGNTPAAIDLAKKFSEKMKLVRDENFTKGDTGISLTDGNFVTYCELRPGQCAFVVHVPQYRKFEDDAKESLADLAWEADQETVAGTLQEGDDLGVGMKGDFLFGSVMVGIVASPDDPDYGLEDESEEEANLHPFFEPEKAEAAEQPVIELPTEMPAAEGAKTEPEPPVEIAPPPAEAPPSEAPKVGEPAPANETSPAP